MVGIGVAFPAFYALVFAGTELFASVGTSAGPGREFAVSSGSAIFFIFVTLLTIAGLIVVARARISPEVRAFSIAFLCVMLGLFSLCDLVSISS